MQTNQLFDEIDDELEESLSQNEQFEHFRFVVDKGQALLRVDKYLVNCMSNISRNRIQEAADAETILVNDQPVKSNYRVKPNDVISIVLDYPKNDFSITPQDIPLNVVYEDADLMVVNKQPDLVVHPGFGNFDGTLLNAIAWHLKDNPHFDANDPRIGLVHRIDKDTSGLILIAKNEDAKSKLALQFFNKTTERTYNALVWGVVKEDEGTIIGSLARDPRDRMLFKVFPDGENEAAKHAVTHYKVIERFTYVTLVECRLETGRTHQIRVHLKHIGHTLFNDVRYGGNEPLKGVTASKYKQFVKNCFDICPRQALHAKTLGFVHPTTGEKMQFDSELPQDMAELLDKWRKYVPNSLQE
ncbi:MAG TPA: RluA family pseudouridine synthase [Paludibacteraceae bacterium]|nr:RluA family pseudouridine synthase [Paludibacteraceae bacterium]